MKLLSAVAVSLLLIYETKAQDGASDLTCNNWLKTTSFPSFLTIGDVDVSGNQLTVEAVFIRTEKLNNNVYYGDLVSKHNQGGAPLNYALLPNGCEISTDEYHYLSTFHECEITLNKIYHVAMVYDGESLKFYRNGFLMSQRECSGNLKNNDTPVKIGQVAGPYTPFANQFFGYINEIRIWKIVRTQSELRTYMSKSLPNPSQQNGLLAYYIFNSSENRQGNKLYDGKPSKKAVINTSVPDCKFTADTCQDEESGKIKKNKNDNIAGNITFHEKQQTVFSNSGAGFMYLKEQLFILQSSSKRKRLIKLFVLCFTDINLNS